jgi:hypothetical protein
LSLPLIALWRAQELETPWWKTGNERQQFSLAIDSDDSIAVIPHMIDDHLPSRPWRSLLLPHLDEIRAMRRARRTWREIATHLRAAHGIKIAPSNVYRFFKRAVQGRKLPLGFEDPPTTEAEGHLQVDRRRAGTEGLREEQTHHDQPISVMPITQPNQHSIFTNWTPEKGINYTPKEF